MMIVMMMMLMLVVGVGITPMARGIYNTYSRREFLSERKCPGDMLL
jgi:hypothetical protein